MIRATPINAFPGVSHLLHLETTESTQTVARAMAEDGAADRTLVWADQQSKGRGRMTRRWDSSEGGLYLSLILKPKFPPSSLAAFSLMTAQAAAAALAAHAGIKAAVKPPNDVIVLPQRRKICGILAEASGDSSRLDWLVVGVGINANNATRAKGATSLKALTGKSWDVALVLKKFLEEFNQSYEQFWYN